MTSNNVTVSTDLEKLFEHSTPLYSQTGLNSDSDPAFLVLSKDGEISCEYGNPEFIRTDAIRHGLTMYWNLHPNISGSGLEKLIADCLPILSKLHDERDFYYSEKNELRVNLSEKGQDLQNSLEDICNSGMYDTMTVCEWDEYYSYDTLHLIEALTDHEDRLRYTKADVMRLAQSEVAQAALEGYSLCELDFPEFIESIIENRNIGHDIE